MPGNLYDQTLQDLETQSPAGLTGAAPAKNPYDQTLDQQDAARETRLRTSVIQAQETTPDRAAKVSALSQRTGLPAEVIERNFDAIVKRAQIVDTPYTQMQRETPALATWAEQPQNMAVAHDDLEPLGMLEWLVTAPQRAVRQGIAQVAYGQLRSEGMRRTLTAEEHDRLATLKAQMDEGGALGTQGHWFRGAITGTAQQIPLWVGALMQGVKYAGPAAATTGVAGLATGGPAAAVPLFGLGWAGGMIAGGVSFTADIEAGLALDEYEAFRDELGQPLDPGVAKVAAAATGLINGLIEQSQIETLAKHIPGVETLTSGGVRTAVRTALRVPTVRAALASAAKTYVGTLAAETGQEVAQRAVTILSGEIAKGLGGPGKVPGMLASGNINLFQQPRVANPDGTISTVDSVGVNLDGKEYLLPTVTPDGRHFSGTELEVMRQAVHEFRNTGRHLGLFDSQAASDAYAKQLHNDYAAGVYDQPSTFRTLPDIGADLASEAAGALQSFALMVAPGPLLEARVDLQRARQAAHNVNFFTALGEGVTNSKTVQRAPAAAQAFLEQATKDGPLSHVYAPVDTWTSYWQSQGVDPAEMAATVTGDPKAYQQAIDTGADLPIPTARYAVTLAGTEHNAFLANELRLAPDQMNAREAAAFQQQLADAPPSAAPDSTAPAAAIRTAVLSQLEAAGVPTATAEQYASLYESAFQTLGERAGVDPVQLFESYGLRIDRPDLQTTSAETAAAATGAAVDTGSTTAQTPGSGSQPPADRGVARARRDAGSGVPESRPGGRENDVTSLIRRRAGESDAQLERRRADHVHAERERRRTEHFDALFADVTAQAHAVDPAVTTDQLRPEFDFRVSYWDDKVQAYRDSGQDPTDLLRAIAAAGGIGAESEGGLTGERRWLMEGSTAGRVKGIQVFRARTLDDRGAPKTGLGFDVMVQRLQQDPRFQWIGDTNTLIDAIDDAVRHDALYEEGVYPGSDQLASELGIDPATAWWQDPWRPGAQPATETSETADTGTGDVSFDPSEFGQSLFDALDAVRTSTPTTDTLPTGEQQPRLPGAEGVREQDIATPQFEAPFALTPETSTAKKGTQTTLFQENRGRIRFSADRQVKITLFEKADLSTFLHETGHFFLEVLRDAANRPDAKPEIRADMATLETWFADEDHTGPGFSTQQHEQFARGFEAYLMEGKAPSLELREVFSRFRAWLLGIYRSLRGLNVDLTDEVRGVFDRLLATDQAIAEVEQANRIAPMFTTAESAGMTPERFERYRATVADASRQAREQVDQRLMADVQREQQASWQAQRAERVTTVTAEVQQRPVYRALAAIRNGTNPDGTPLVEGGSLDPLKLSKAMLVDRYGEDRVTALPRPYVYTVTGGLDPDFVAERFGFSSGDALLTAITEAAPMRDVINAEVDRRMLAEYGSVLLDGTLHEKAQAATANDAREEVVRAEMRALGNLKRTAAPFEAAGRADVATAKREQAYERRWLEAEVRLRIAIAQGYKQVEIDALRDEIRQLRQQARGGAATIAASIPPAAVLREYARARVARTRIRDLNPAVFWSASRRAAQQAIDHAARQDFDAAITAKQQELINLALYRDAERAKVDVAARVAFAQGLTKTAARERLGLAGESYQDQVDGILDRYSLATVSQKALDRRASLSAWIAAQEADGLPVDLPESLLEDTRRTPYQELTVEALVGITDGLKQIVHLARLKNKLLKSEDRRAFGTVRDGLVTSIRDHNTEHPLPLEFSPSGEKWRRIAGWFAALRKIAMLARAMDGDVDGGPLWEALIRPINAAADAKQARNRVEGAAYHAILERHYPGRELGRMGELMHIPAIGGSLSREARLAVGLNQGTEGNRDRVLADPRRRWNQSQVTAILDTLDRRDWAFIQDTWDFVDTFWREIEAKQRRVTGLAPEKVVAVPVDTKFGPLRGGYYPLAYDPRLSIRAGQHQAATEITMAGAANYVRTTTRRGFVEERKKNVHLPLRLELGVMFAHVDQVIHDLTHHEMLIDVTRLVRDPQVSDAILETRGSAIYQQFSTALQDIALGSLSDRNVMDRAASWMRRRTQMALLGANLWTAAQQPLGLFNGMQRVGPQWVMRGMTRWLRDAASMQNTSAWISEVSPMMRGRVETASPELLELRTRLREAGGWFDTLVRRVSADHLTQQTILDGYMWHIGVMQRVADIPTWLGQYEKSMAGGETETRAIALADQAVIDSQGGGQIKDLAQVQRGGGMARLFTMFYSYGSTLLNANINAAEAANFKSPASVLTFLGHLSLLNVMPAVATVALAAAAGRSGGKDDDPEWWLTHIAGETLSGALNGLVLIREATAAAQIAMHLDPGVRGYEGPAGTRIFQLLTDLAVQVNQGQPDEALAKAVNNVAGILFRYPALQVQRTVDGWTALEDGRTSNPFALVVGAPRKQK